MLKVKLGWPTEKSFLNSCFISFRGIYRRKYMQEIISTNEGLSNKPIFYVYVHRTLDTGKIFYVGKGKANRAWTEKGRNRHWNNVATKHGFTVEIVFNLLTEDQAFRLEEEIISQYGLDQLTNQTLGGVSTTGYRHSITDRKNMSNLAKDRLQRNPELLNSITSRISKLAESQTKEQRISNMKKARDTVENYTEEEKALYLELKQAWRSDPKCVAAHSKSIQEFWNSEEGIKCKQEFSERFKKQWEDEKFAEKIKTVAKQNWLNPEFKSKMLDIRSCRVIVNRKLVLPSLKDFSDKYNHGSCINNILRNSLDKGYIGALINGYLVEKYSEEIHKDASTEYLVTPLINFDLPRSVAINADGRVYLRPSYLAVELGAKNPETTAEWLSKCAKNNREAFGYNLSVATVEDINSEIIRRITEWQEQQKQI